MWLLNAASTIVAGKFKLDDDESLVFLRDLKVEYNAFIHHYRQLIEKIDKSRYESDVSPSLDALISGLACFIHHLSADNLTHFDPRRLIQPFIVLIMMCIEQHHPSYHFEDYAHVANKENAWMAVFYDDHIDQVKINHQVTEKTFKKIYAYIINDKETFYHLLKVSHAKCKRFLAAETKRKDNHSWVINTALLRIENVTELSQRSVAWLELRLKQDLNDIQDNILSVYGDTIPYDSCIIPIEILLEALSIFFFQLEDIEQTRRNSDVTKEQLLDIFDSSVISALTHTNVVHSYTCQLDDLVYEDEYAEHSVMVGPPLTPERVFAICKFIPINYQLQLHNLIRYTKQPESQVLPHLPLPRHHDWYINAIIWKVQQTFPALNNNRMSTKAVLVKFAVLMEKMVQAVEQCINEENEYHNQPREEHYNIFSIDVTASLVSQFSKRLSMMPKNHAFNYDEIATIFLIVLMLTIKYKNSNTRSCDIIHLINDSLLKNNKKLEMEHFLMMGSNLTFKIQDLRNFYKSLPEGSLIRPQLMRCLQKDNNPTSTLIGEYLATILKDNDPAAALSTSNDKSILWRLRKKDKNRKRKRVKELENELAKAFEDKLTELWSVRADRSFPVRKPPVPAKAEPESSQVTDGVYMTPMPLFRVRIPRYAAVAEKESIAVIPDETKSVSSGLRKK